MADNLAPIYLDNNRISLKGDPRPKISKILEASGKGKMATDQVMQLASQKDDKGKVLRAEDTIDRTQQANVPVYLKYVAKADAGTVNMAQEKSAHDEPKSGLQQSLRSQASTGKESTTAPLERTREELPDSKEGAAKDASKGKERFESENVEVAEEETVQAPKGAGEPGRSQEGKQAKQFGQQDTDVEQKDRDVTPRGKSQHITGMGQSQQSGAPLKVDEEAGKPEWKAATPGSTTRHEKQGSRHGGKPSVTGSEEKSDVDTFDQPDKQAEATEDGGEESDEHPEGGKQGRGNRPGRRREDKEPNKEAEGEEPVA